MGPTNVWRRLLNEEAALAVHAPLVLRTMHLRRASSTRDQGASSNAYHLSQSWPQKKRSISATVPKPSCLANWFGLRPS